MRSNFGTLSLFLATSLASCTRHKPIEHAQRDDDARPIPKDEPARDRVVLIGKDFVDVVDHRVVFALAERPLLCLLDSREAYALKISPDDMKHMHWTVVDLVDRKERGTFDLDAGLGGWPATLDEHDLYVSTSGVIHAFDRSTGLGTEIVRLDPKKSVEALWRVGGSLLVQISESFAPGVSFRSFSFIDLDTHDVHVPEATSDYPMHWLTTETRAFVVDPWRAGNAPPIGGGVFKPTVALVTALDDHGKKLWERVLDKQPVPPVIYTFAKRPTKHHLLYASSYITEPSYVLKQDDGSIAGSHLGMVRAISETEAGALQWMFVSTSSDEKAAAYDAYDASDVKRWTVTMPCTGSELQAAARGDTLVLAHFMDDGSCVAAIDRATGVTKWSLELPKGHGGRELSPYQSELRLRSDEIVMIGRNMFSDTLDILSLSSGATLFSHDGGHI